MAILNHRDYRLARARLAQLDRVVGGGIVSELEEQLPPEAANSRRLALETERLRLASAVAAYERLRADDASLGDGLDGELGLIPILGRISRQLSQRELADLIGVKEQQIQRYERDRYASISLDRYDRILKALGVELHPRLVDEPKEADAPPVLDIELKPELLRELRKRNWVDLPRGAAPSAMKGTLARYIERQAGDPGRVLNRQTRSRRPSSQALSLWIARVLEVASESKGRLKGKFNITDTAWLSRLVALSAFPDGPVRAANLLRENGIIFVLEPQLPTTMLDGAALLTSDGVPVVALTLRHDRIDNFWFTLLHELGHVFLHFGPSLKEGFIDDDLGEANVSDLEREADDFARTRLIPDDVWRAAPVRFTKSREAVEKFARRINVHPAIVAGRIRKERDYSLFSDVVGLGQVKKLFAGYQA